MNRLVLIDGNAILHRAYHALPPVFTAPDGTLVNAVYGFASMLIKIFRDLKPTHIAVAFDRAAPTFRTKMFKEYQAQRPKMEDELASQIEKVHAVIAAFGIPMYEIDGFEADDVIGTIDKHAKEKKIDQVVIVTGDRDLLQLVDKNTFAYMPTKGLSEAKLLDEAAVKEKMGVRPEQIPDFKALAGDASDNYPGVAGIGPKTASELLETHKSLEEVFKDKRLPAALASKLSSGKESAFMSQKLATIRTDAPIDIDLGKARLTTLDTPASRQALEELHFPSLLKRLTQPEEKQRREMKKGKKKPSGTSGQLSLV